MTPGARRTLARDERGAVLLVGIFAAVFLFGAAWFVLGTGDAIEHRETMQDAADSGAQSVAVLHARAMNMVSLLNLSKLTVAATVTSALAAVVGATKTIAWINSSPALLAALGSALPLLAAVEARATADLASMRGDADAVIRAADRAQETLRTRLPELAAAQANRTAVAYGPPVERGSLQPRPLPIRRGEPLELCQRALPLARPPALSRFDQVSPEPARQHARVETEAALLPTCLSLNVAAMELEPNTRLGGERLQLRYFALGAPPPEHGESGIRVATWNRTPEEAAQSGGLAFAQAEYYLDAEGAEAQQLADELYTLGWRARFRRFRPPSIEAEIAAACDQGGAAACGTGASAPAELAARVAH
jgi:hypothetical protein